MYQVCDSDFARQLERELQEANKRIKRLEEAGDEVVINYVNSLSAFEIWRKAKEAKP
jgi:cob(I)alamin adenosyltransferase